MFSIRMTGDTAMIARLEALPSALRTVLEKRVRALTLRLEARVKAKLSGQVLNVRTGALRRSIQSEVRSTAETITGRVFSTGDVKYARIHEMGGIIKHPGGTAYFKRADGLAVFVSNDHVLSAIMPKTRPHDIKMPARSFLRSSLRDMNKEIRESLTKGVVQSAMSGGE